MKKEITPWRLFSRPKDYCERETENEYKVIVDNLDQMCSS